MLPKGLAPMQEAHRKYLRSRGYDPDELERRWSLQGLGLEAGELRWRIFIPVILHGKTVSWITRSISDKEVARRYYTATKKQEVYFHKDLLYGIDYARYSIVIVEGVFDAWRIGPGAVATFGTRVSDAQIVQIASFQERYICFDKGAERYSQRLVNELSLYPGKTYEVQLNAKDPGSATQKELKKLRRLIQ